MFRINCVCSCICAFWFSFFFLPLRLVPLRLSFCCLFLAFCFFHSVRDWFAMQRGKCIQSKRIVDDLFKFNQACPTNGQYAIETYIKSISMLKWFYLTFNISLRFVHNYNQADKGEWEGAWNRFSKIFISFLVRLRFLAIFVSWRLCVFWEHYCSILFRLDRRHIGDDDESFIRVHFNATISFYHRLCRQ